MPYGTVEVSRDSICISDLCEKWIELDGLGVPLPLLLSSTCWISENRLQPYDCLPSANAFLMPILRLFPFDVHSEL